MKTIIGLALVVLCLYILKRFARSSSAANLLNAGATKVPISPELQAQEPLGLAAISPARYENRVRILLKDDGIYVALKDEATAYFLPLSLVTLTGNSWLHNPLVFGKAKCRVELDLGCEVTEAIKSMKSCPEHPPMRPPSGIRKNM